MPHCSGSVILFGELIWRTKMTDLNCSRGLQSGHSMFTKSKKEAQRCVKELRKDKGQIRVRVVRARHTLRGKGWRIETY